MDKPDNKREDNLVENIQKGDIAAFEELYNIYKERIYRTCLRILGNQHDAEDVLHDVFIKIYENINQFRSDARFSTWIYQIAINTALSRQSQRKKHSSLPSLDTFPTNTQEAKEITLEQDHLIAQKIYFQKAIDKLSPKLKICLILRIIEGLSYEEISKVLKIPVGTVKSRINSARENLEILFKKTELFRG